MRSWFLNSKVGSSRLRQLFFRSSYRENKSNRGICSVQANLVLLVSVDLDGEGRQLGRFLQLEPLLGFRQAFFLFQLSQDVPPLVVGQQHEDVDAEALALLFGLNVGVGDGVSVQRSLQELLV